LAPLMMNVTLRADATIDLHMHTMYSDGRWPATQLVDYLVAEQYDLVAVTDHDRVDKVAAIQALAAAKHLPVLSGVEMGTDWHGAVGQGRMGDMLCYGFDPAQNELAPLTEKIARQKLENVHLVYDTLRQQGYEFPRQAEVLANSQGQLRYSGDNIQLLREHGYAPNWHVAFDMITKAGYRSIRVDMAETVEAVHRSGGVCLIAHPGRREANFTFYDIPLLDQLRAEIPIDGIELLHPTHSAEMTEQYRNYIQQHDLLCTTGSDSHCIPTRMPRKYRADTSRKFLERVGIHVED